MMSDLNFFVNPEPIQTSNQELVQEASLCLDRFTAAFNTCDTQRIDNELHFPHCMYSGSELMIWNSAGQHPSDFFEKLKITGWSSTRYINKHPVLVSKDKVHFVVEYVRCDIDDRVISNHTNLWFVTKINGKWGFSLRSY